MKTRIARFSIFSSLLCVLLIPVQSLAQDRVVESATHRFIEVADGVWFATGSEVANWCLDELFKPEKAAAEPRKMARAS